MENIRGSHPPPQVSLPLFFIAVSKERALNFTEKREGRANWRKYTGGGNFMAESGAC